MPVMTQCTWYLRGHGAISHVSACVKHGLRVVQLWREPGIYPRYDCAKHLESIKDRVLRDDLESHSRKTTDFDKWVDNHLAYRSGEVWLDLFPLHAAATCSQLLGHAVLRRLMTEPSRVCHDDLWLVYELGFKVALQDGVAIHQALRDLQELPAVRVTVQKTLSISLRTFSRNIAAWTKR